MMKKYIAPFIILWVVFVVFSGCSKNDGNSPLGGGKSFTMKVDGVEWKSAMTTLFTEADESSGRGKYHLVYIGGNRIIEKNSATEDDLAESLGLYIIVPEGKFGNPKGTYPILIKESGLNRAWGLFASSTDIRDAMLYVSGDPQDPDKSVGMLEITSFEIGKQNVLGQSTEVEGYTKLSGSFHLEVYPMEGNGRKLNITDGKFDLTSGIGIDFNAKQ